MELKNRKDMDSAFQWDFTDIFESDEAWEKELNAIAQEIPKVASYEGKLGNGVKVMKEAFDFFAEIMRRTELVYIYAMLHKSADASEPKHLEMEGKAMMLYVQLSSSLAFLNPEILAIPEKKLNKIMANKKMALYKHMVEDITRARPHTLDAKTEKIMAMMSDFTNTPSNVYDALTDVDMELPKIKDENGEEVQLTSGNFGVFRINPNKEVRDAAFNAMFGTYKKFNNTIAANYAGEIKSTVFGAKVRNFGSACESAIFNSNVPVAVYDSLIEAVHNALPTMKKYIELRKKVLGLEKIDMYDMYVPMVDDVEMKFTFEESREIIKNALAPLGEEYAKLLDEAYDNRWMDVYENKGKTSGAFSCGIYGVHPYVLLNFTETFDDVSTIAHELGHAMHSYKSSKAQEYINSDYKIMVAEVASTVNEVLLTKYMLNKETDPKKKAYLLNHFLEGFRTTVFRQTLFAEFEKKAHEMAEAGIPLTGEALNKLYRELECLYYEGAEVPEMVDYEWSYIPHFYRCFYVYQYATGFSSAVAIADNILTTGNADNYLKFLSTGGSDYPLEELKIAGVDLTKPEAVGNAMKVFAETLDELEKLLETL